MFLITANCDGYFLPIIWFQQKEKKKNNMGHFILAFVRT